MRIVIAIDSLKGSLTSKEAGEAIKAGILKVDQTAEVQVRSIADGGEGTVDAMIEQLHGKKRTVRVLDPLGRSIRCSYGLVPEEHLAVIEMAAASGLPLLEQEERDILHATTYGVGQLIADAIAQGCRKFLIGLGGSATNDGGLGMLEALGYRLLTGDGKPIPHGAIGLQSLETILDDDVLPQLQECVFQIASDVNNPLCGELGATAVYGIQKGATPEMIPRLDAWMEHYAQVAKEFAPSADPNMPGAGAAGGLGFAFQAFLGGKLEPGIQIMLRETKFAEDAKWADLVITGEGKIDGQTAMGKTPVGVANVAKTYGKPVIAFAGSVAKDAGNCNQSGIDAFFPILRRIVTLKEAMEPKTARENLMETAEQVYRLWLLGKTKTE